MQNKPLLNVTDLSRYLYCPRQFFLEKVKGLRQPPTKPMIEGSIRHKVLEYFSNKEQQMIENLELILDSKTINQIIKFYTNFLNQIIKKVFLQNRKLIYAFKINMNELKKKILNSLKNDIQLRAEAIEQTAKKGHKGPALWENLSPKYLSELKLESETLGLKGRADRVMFNLEQDIIIPYELKTRPTEKIWPSDEIQLTAYTMLLEEFYKTPISLAILESGNTKHELIITESMKQKVIDLLQEVNQVLNQTTPPRFPFNFSKCQNCFFEDACNNLD